MFKLTFFFKKSIYYSPIQRNAILVISIRQALMFLPKFQGVIEHLSYPRRSNLFILFVHMANVYVPHHRKPLMSIFRMYIWSRIFLMPLNAKLTCNTVDSVNHFHARVYKYLFHVYRNRILWETYFTLKNPPYFVKPTGNVTWVCLANYIF